MSYVGDYIWMGDAKSGCERILKDTGIAKEEWQMGVIKAFIKNPETLFALETMHDRYWHNMTGVTTIRGATTGSTRTNARRASSASGRTTRRRSCMSKFILINRCHKSIRPGIQDYGCRIRQTVA